MPAVPIPIEEFFELMKRDLEKFNKRFELIIQHHPDRFESLYTYQEWEEFFRTVMNDSDASFTIALHAQPTTGTCRCIK